jgi:protease-4
MDSSNMPGGDQSPVDPIVQAEAVRIAPTAGYGPQPQIIVQQPGRRFGFLTWILLSVLGISIMANISQQAMYESYFSSGDVIEEKYVSHSRDAEDKVAVITLQGTIMAGEGFVKDQIDAVREDKSVKAIVLRIDSPGGTVTGSDYIYHHLKELIGDADRKIPMVVSMGSLCASGGYYVAMAVGEEEDRIYAEPTTWTGSIGVIIPHYDMSGLLESWNIEDDSVASHKYKQLLSMTRQRTAEETAEVRAILQDMVDQSFEGFKEIVRSGRPKFREDEEALDAVATGQVFTAKQAVENGLVDQIGFIEDAIDKAITLANLDKNQVRVVKYKRPVTGLAAVLGGSQSQAGSAWPGDLGQLLDMTAPRAYFLCTWMPAILSNRTAD